MMKAALIYSFGPTDVLAVENVATPVPGPNDVLVKVNAASVNPIDYKIRSGRHPGFKREALPMILGGDVAGTVESCGERVASCAHGDAVYAMLDHQGGYAEYALVKEAAVAKKPQRLDFREAAAVPLAALTAWQGLFDHGQLEAGQHVLIHGGAGGVGHFAIQLAKLKGAKVSTTVSGDDLDFARELGADEAIDYRKERFEDRVSDIDLVFDLVGGDTQERSWQVLKQGGVMVSTLDQPSEQKAEALAARAESYMSHPDAVALTEIARLIDAGKVKPHVHRVYPLTEVRMAQHELEQRHVQGKIVLSIGSA